VPAPHPIEWAVDAGVPAASGAGPAAPGRITERYVPEVAGGPGRARDRTAGFDDGPADAVVDVQVKHRAGAGAVDTPGLRDAGQGRVVADGELAARLVVRPPASRGPPRARTARGPSISWLPATVPGTATAAARTPAPNRPRTCSSAAVTASSTRSWSPSWARPVAAIIDPPSSTAATCQVSCPMAAAAGPPGCAPSTAVGLPRRPVAGPGRSAMSSAARRPRPANRCRRPPRPCPRSPGRARPGPRRRLRRPPRAVRQQATRTAEAARHILDQPAPPQEKRPALTNTHTRVHHWGRFRRRSRRSPRTGWSPAREAQPSVYAVSRP
jgi:hypothetical protein